MRKRIITWSLTTLLVAVLVFVFSTEIYGFLAVPISRVEADVVIVEGWVPDYVVRAAGEEYNRGGYRLIVTSEPEAASREQAKIASFAAPAAAALLEKMGIEPSRIFVCPPLLTDWNKTANSARTVRDLLATQHISPKGINVVTIGVHSRRSWLAYQHAFGPGIPVGIIQIPEVTINPSRWWASGLGIKRVTKGYVAWLREFLFGAVL